METSETGPAAKRQRRSHHKTQLVAYCYCARCDGKVRQKPRTIDDHRTRYPSHRPSYRPGEEAPRQAGGEAIENVDQPPAGQPEFSPHSDSDAPARSAGSQSPPDAYNQPPRPRSRTASHSPQPSGDDIQGIQEGGRSPVAQEEDEEIDVDEESEVGYPFNQLIDERRAREYPVPGREEDFGGNGYPGDGAEHEGGLDDEDFSLPHGDIPASAPALPRFQLPDDMDPNQQPEGDPDDDDDPNVLCAAFQEPDLIRNAYIDVLVQKNLYGATHRALKHQLESARRTLASHPNIAADDIAKMAQSIATVERRLGVNTADLITTFTLCPTCNRRYSPEYINDAESDLCLNDECDGVLFTIRKLASGAKRRVSNLTYPYASPIAWLRHMLGLAGVSELIQTWRTRDDDNAGLVEPLSDDQWLRDMDPDKPIGDISEGFGWRSTYAGLQRVWDPAARTVSDESTLDPPVRFVSLLFGVSLSLNTDWFQATKEGNYSVGACYLVINNLPRHMRFLRENIALTIVMPGPNEPNGYALDQMLDPLVDDLLRLKQGVRMLVRKGDPPTYDEEVVHGELSQHIADLIARIKMGGGAGVKSELNFCLYCHARLSSISVEDGFVREDFRFRDPAQDLNNAYRWRSAPSQQEKKEMFNQTGNRFTSLHRLPGWHTSTLSPVDAMHLLYLGGMNWIVKQILVGPGMLSKPLAGGDSCQDIFNDCLDRMWMPQNFQCLPPKLGQTRISIKVLQPNSILVADYTICD